MKQPHKLPKPLGKEFLSFLETHPPQQFSGRLRSMVLEYLRYELKAGTFPLYLDDFLWSLNDLFDLFDEAAKHFNQVSSLSPLRQSQSRQSGKRG